MKRYIGLAGIVAALILVPFALFGSPGSETPKDVADITFFNVDRDSEGHEPLVDPVSKFIESTFGLRIQLPLGRREQDRR